MKSTAAASWRVPLIAFFALAYMGALNAQVRQEDSLAVAQAMAYFSANAQQYGLTDPASELRATKSDRDPRFTTHVRYQQFYGNIKVFGGEAIAHVEADGRITVTDGIRKGLNIDVNPVVQQSAALTTAVGSIGLRGNYTVQLAELQILPKGERSTVDRLVWHFTISVMNDIDTPGRWDVFIDAKTGAVTLKFDSLETAASLGKGRTMYSGTVDLNTDQVTATNQDVNSYFKLLPGSPTGKLESPPCAIGKIYVVFAAWQNTSEFSVRDLDARKSSLSGNNQLISTELTLPAGGVVAPGATVQGTFRINLAACSSFSFWVNLVGTFDNYFLRDLTRSGNETYDLQHRTSGSGILVFDGANDFGDGSKSNSDPDTAGADAHYGMMMTWDYYKNGLGRNGIDGNGTKTYGRIHYGIDYANAFWDKTCFCMAYGDGNATYFPFVPLDMAGHEMTHGLTQATANLTYSGESGGLNEATSDIFGTMVEFYANNTVDTPDWWIFERIIRSNYSTGSYVQTKAARYMDDPAKDGKSPACWSSTLGSRDVHYSSGPANYMFYLLAEGGTSKPPTPNRQSSDGTYSLNASCPATPVKVDKIGRDKAALIWYTALEFFMSSSTDYKRAREAALAAARTLYGDPSTEVDSVDAAFRAINVN